MARFYILFFVFAQSTILLGECNEGQFDCGNGDCISLALICDGFSQCENYADEEDDLCVEDDSHSYSCILAGGVPVWISDGYCDASNNNVECDWDGGDCCEDTCVDDDYQCGEFYQFDLDSDSCWDNCYDPSSDCGGGVPICEGFDFHVYANSECAENYTNSIIVSWNSMCDIDEICIGDNAQGMNCFHLGYTSSPLFISGFPPNSTYFFQLLSSELGSSEIISETTISTDCMSQNPFQECGGLVYWISDGYCDEMNNNSACGFDGGDCCECTCIDLDYECGIVGYECEDPSIDCYDEIVPEEGFTIDAIQVGQRTDGSGIVDVEFEMYALDPNEEFRVLLELSTDMGNTYFPIFENDLLIASVGLFEDTWDVPSQTYVDDVILKIRLEKMDNSDIYIEEFSPTFTVDTIPPEVQVQTPNGGEHIDTNDDFVVVWSTEDNSVIRYEMDVYISTGLGEVFTLEVDDVEMQGMMNAAEVELDMDDDENVGRYAKVNVTVTDLFGNEGFDESDDFFILGDPEGECVVDWFSEEEDLILLDWGWRAGHILSLHRNAIADLMELGIIVDGSRFLIKDQNAILDMDCNGSSGDGILADYTFYSQYMQHVGLKAYEGIDNCAEGGTRYPGYVLGDEIILHIINPDSSAYSISPDINQMSGPTTYTGGMTIISRLDNAIIEEVNIEDLVGSVVDISADYTQNKRDYDGYNIYRSTNQTNFRNCTDDPDCELNGIECVCKIETMVTQTFYFDNYAAQSDLWCYKVWLLDNNIDQNEVLKTVDTCMSSGGDESGCTDSQAVNYNPNSTLDDGSCLYATEIPILNGWNWVSTNIQNDDMSLNNTLNSASPSISYIKDQNSFSDYYVGFGWWGSLDSLNLTSMYKLVSSAQDTISYIGGVISPDLLPVNITSGWNWLGFPLLNSQDINSSLTSIDGLGTYIKNQVSFADYYNPGGWWGTLSQLSPYEGYMLNASSTGTLVYPSSSLIRNSVELNQNDRPSLISSWKVIPADYEFSGSVMLGFESENSMNIQAGDYIAMFKADELRGVVESQESPFSDEYIFPLMVYSNEEVDVDFEMKYFSNIDGSIYEINTKVDFENNMHIGNAEDLYVVSGFNVIENELPEDFKLGTIYPNPFNPSTNIPYSVSESSHIAISVHDIQGKEVERIINESKDSGHYNVTWNPNSLPSGVYFIKMYSIDGIQVKKILLLK